MLVADVIERVYRDYLTPPGEQPTRFKVGTGGIDSSATTLPIDTALLSPEEQGLIGPGAILEVAMEWMLVEAVSGDPPTSLTVRRGMYGTDAAGHSEGDLITLAPTYPRKSVFDAVGDAIEGLWPRLWHIDTELIVTDTTPVDLPEDCEEVLEVRAPDTLGRWVSVEGWEFVTNLPVSTTGKSIQFLASRNAMASVKYRAKATRPTDEDDDLTDLGVEESWVKAICVAAVAHLASGMDLNKATVEFVTKALEMEGVRIGEGSDLRNALLQYHGFLVETLSRGLEASQPGQVVIHAEI